MLEKRSEKILLSIIVVLLTLLAVDRIWSRMSLNIEENNQAIAQLRSELKLLDTNHDRLEEMQTTLEGLDKRANATIVESQTMFRRYLEDSIGSRGNIESVRPMPPIDLPDFKEMNAVRFSIRLRMKLNDLIDLLAEFDQTDQPLQVSYLHVTSALFQTRMLVVEMTVSTLAKNQEAS